MSISTQPFVGTYVLDPVPSTAVFAVRHIKVSIFRASFDAFEGRLVADDNGVWLTGTVPVETVSIGSRKEFRVPYHHDKGPRRTHILFRTER